MAQHHKLYYYYMTSYYLGFFKECLPEKSVYHCYNIYLRSSWRREKMKLDNYLQTNNKMFANRKNEKQISNLVLCYSLVPYQNSNTYYILKTKR